MKELYFYEVADGKVRLYKVSLKQRWRVWKDHPNAISISKMKYDALMDKYNDERLAKEKALEVPVVVPESFWQKVKRFFGHIRL